MKRIGWMAALLLSLIAASQGLGGEPPCCELPRPGFLQRLSPIGGWHPYGGGLLRWWDPCCIPHWDGPDDYCRKPLPKVCWPAYRPDYTWGPAEICNSETNCPKDCHKPH